MRAGFPFFVVFQGGRKTWKLGSQLGVGSGCNLVKSVSDVLKTLAPDIYGKNMLTIQTWGGWGDALREISLLPAFRFPGLIGVRHLPPELAGVRVDARAPSVKSVKDLLDRCPSIQWKGVGSVSRGHKYLTRGLRVVIEPFHPGLFDPGFVWRSEDEIAIDSARKQIVIQTHLEGLPAKRWAVENWRGVLSGLRSRHPGACIHVLDPAGAALADEGIVVQDRLTFPQAIRLVEQCSLLISVDSWSKYVAGWKNIPQLVIVPDQTSDYPQLTASTIWRYSFRGLHKNRNLKLIGLAPENTKQARYTFGPMSALRPQDVLQSLLPL